jgi:lipopolysaccharide/colanic/teichoic acid biosynthesis glycosyltransferase
MLRLIDIFLAAGALILLSPLFLITIIILRLTGEKEVFFLQERVGRYGKPFKLIKFATMLKASPSMATGTVTIKDDPRVLPFGKVLRSTKINELPQLLNVLNGSMSVIGPRPQTRRCFDAFPVKSQNEIMKIRPGLSGVGSIIFRQEEEMMSASIEADKFYDDIIMPYKGVLEEWYVANASISIYFKCIFITVFVIFSPNSRLAWRMLSDLPEPPTELTGSLNYK